LDALHAATLNLLENMGIIVRSDKALSILEESGASIDARNRIAKIPEHLVEETIKLCPKTARLCGRRSDLDIVCDGKHTHLVTNTCGTLVMDLETGARRDSTKDDVAKSALIVDALEDVGIYCVLVTPTEKPPGVRVLHEYDAAVNNTEKFIMTEVYSPEETDYLLKMACAVAGGVDELVRRPIVGTIACTISPLILDGKQTDSALAFARVNAPISVMAMPIIGGTAPITIAGSMILGNAQMLGLATVLQMANPGTPVFHSLCPVAMDVRHGTMGTSFPGAILESVGGVQLAKYYGLPSYTGSGSASKIPDEQAAYEKALHLCLLYLSGVDLDGGIGLLDNTMTLSYEQMLLDYEAYTMIENMCHEIRVDDDTMALDMIRKVGHEGHFLAEKHSIQHAKESWIPVLTDSQPYRIWKEAGAKSVVERAKEKARQLLATHKPKPLEPHIQQELTQIIVEVEKKKHTHDIVL